MSTVPDNGARRGLGRGLEVLMGGARVSELTQLPLESIHPNPRQPRRRLEPESTSGLAESVGSLGVVQPVIVRPRLAGGWELIAGERRWRAAREAGMATVPALVRDVDDRDSLLIALVENVAREDLSAAEEARAYAVLIDEFALSLGEVAGRVGRSKPAVSNKLRLLELPDDVLAMLERGELSEGHARAVLAVPNQAGRRELARRIIQTGMSVRSAEQAARWAGAKRKPRKKMAVDPALAQRARAAIEDLTGFPARVGAGRIEIPFMDEHHLAELVEALERAGTAA